VTPEIPLTEAVTSEQIPLCAFNVQAQSLTSTSLLDTYVFSEPKVVLTSTTAIRLFQWLPDNRRWLIGRAKTEVAGEYIETFDLDTGEIKQYAERHSSAGKPIWLSMEQAVAFVDSIPPDYSRMLYLGRGEDRPLEELARDLVNPLLSLSPDGQIVYSANGRGIQAIQVHSPSLSRVLIANLPGQGERGWAYSDAWRVDGTMAAVYVYKTGKFYLVDQVIGKACEMDLGQADNRAQKISASDMAWSADGRYLALRRVYGNPERFLSLRIIDTFTREFRDMTFEERSVHGLNWAPGGNVLLVAVDADPDPTLGSFDSLYILDATACDFRPVLPKHQFFGAGYDGIFWSPDGKSIGVPCPDFMPPDEMREWRICVISVEMK